MQSFNTASPPIGVRPVFPGKRPPYRPDVPCHTNQLPNLNAARVGPPDGGQGPATGSPPPAQGGNASPLPLPTLPLPRAQRDSVANQLLSRLNPFRGAKKGSKRRAPVRPAGRKAGR